MSDLYENLLKATDNTSDITNEKYGTVTKINGALCSVIEEDTNLEHTNVPVLNQIYLETGDKVVIGFVSNSIYNPIIVGNLTRRIRLSADDIIEPSSLNNLGLPANSSQHQINLKVNEKINQGGGSGGSVDWSDIENKPSDYPPSSHNHDSRYYTESEIDTALSNKVSKSSTSGLLKNDGTVDTSSYITSSALSNYVQKSNTTGLLKNDGTVDTTSYSTFSGSYNDLSNKPTIPTKISDLTNDSDFIEKSNTSGLVKNDGSVDTTQYLSSLPSHNHDDRYYTETEMDTALSGKQATLVSGTNIKTINNTSLLGSGNISIQGGGSVTVDSALSTTSENPVQNKVITGALNGKADSSSLSTVATSGSYNDLSNKPSIPSKTSDLTNDGADGTNVFIANNDSRLSDARTPLAHTHLSSDVTDLIDVIYPVGSIYMSVGNTSPSVLFGGTWQKIEDKFLLASGTTYANESTGGSADAVVVSHTHTQAQHRHELTGSKTTGMSSGNYLRAGYGSATDGQYTNYSTPTINSTGEDGTGKNMPPYFVVNVWKRTA